MSQSFDLMVIGGGSAGYAAARVATDRGMRVAMIEQGPFGGLCILRGCMPSKTLIRSAELAHLATHSRELGITTQGMTIDYPAIVRRKDAIIRSFADYRYQEVRERPLITMIEGRARFLDPHRLAVDDQVLTAPRTIITTGSRVAVPDIPGLAEQGYLTSDEALSITTLPQRLVVIGGGVIACELGHHFARMGVSVTILQRGAHLLSHEDPDVGQALAGYFAEEGMTVYTGVTFHEVTRHGRLKMVVVSTGGKRLSVHGDELLVAAGRIANVEHLNLPAADVDGGPEGIRVNDALQTSNPDIFAAGDVTGGLEYTHIAVYQGEVAGTNAILGPLRTTDYRVVPQIVFTDPPFARVGLNEREANRAGRPVLVATYPYDDLGKAITAGQTKGFVKMLADPVTGEILGTALLGAGAPELIHELVVAMHYRATVGDFLRIPHFHPTLAEIFTYPAEELAVKIQ